MTRIIKHTCIDPTGFQDREYGKGNRVMNHAPAKGAQKLRFRCTCCGETVTLK